MDVSDYIYYSTFLVTTGLALTAFALCLSAANRNENRSRYANRFALAALLAGLASGIPFFFGVLWAFDIAGHDVNVGHGVILVAAPLFNFCLGVVLAVVGSVIIRWCSIEW
jgi:hypothetical protein